jgi:hypothetical protein
MQAGHSATFPIYCCKYRMFSYYRGRQTRPAATSVSRAAQPRVPPAAAAASGVSVPSAVETAQPRAVGVRVRGGGGPATVAVRVLGNDDSVSGNSNDDSVSGIGVSGPSDSSDNRGAGVGGAIEAVADAAVNDSWLDQFEMELQVYRRNLPVGRGR